MVNNENKKICATCQGFCCKSFAGFNHPNDFLPNIEENILTAIKSGNFCISAHTGDPRGELSHILYVRPNITGKTGKIFDRSLKGQCSLLKDTGCELDFDKRPFQCRDLEPNPDYVTIGCKGKIPRDEIVMAWIPFQKFLRKVIEEN